MAEIEMFHNPRCSKSRGALEILGEHEADVEVVEYLKNPPDRATLERILDAIDDPPSALVRRDPKFSELGLTDADVETADGVIDVLAEHPELMQRPVLLRGGRGVIARPSERATEVLD